ncbi:MAG: hypothetical protein KBE65_18775 [Phycisphaerae bacterium]|nr:hypothetical protein [Phycisphaerae bacterium]
MKLTDEQLDTLRKVFRLSPRETQVVALLFKGVGTTDEKAQRLGVGVPAVKLVLRMLYAKVGVSSKHEVIVRCLDVLNPRF